MIPPAIAVVTKVGGKLLVKQTLKSTTKQLVIRNAGYAGERHPITNVLFNSKGFPVFNGIAKTKLSQSYWKSSNTVQFEQANKWLKTETFRNSTLRNKFNSSQIKEIAEGKTPTGYTWHHHEDTGYLELVLTSLHKGTGHTGGKAIWGSL